MQVLTKEMPTVKKYTATEALIDVLNVHGINHIFFNPGGETAPVQTAIAQLRIAGQPAPEMVLCLDESVALGAAHGSYMASGKPQVVMVHAELGTLQMGGALHNAQWGRVPVVILAGYFPPGERVNWRKEPYDQGWIVRNCVKWDHDLQPGENFTEVLHKALQIAYSEPRGPVYLYFPFFLFLDEVPKTSIPSQTRSPEPDSLTSLETLAEAADILVKASNPLIVLGHTGRYPETVPLLVELAETLGAPVITSQVWMNFPTTHPLCAGIEQFLGSRKGNPYLADADAVLAIDYTMPYALAEGIPGKEAKIIQIDMEPTTQGRLLWGRRADIFLKTDSRGAIPALINLLRRKITSQKRTHCSQRLKQIESNYIQLHSEWHNAGAHAAGQKPISPDWFCYCLSKVIDEETILVHHTISHQASLTEQIQRSKPFTLIGCAAGSISWALAAALGAKVACRDKTVISLMTDGGFIWGCPVATLWPAKAYRAPFLAIVFNNQSYGYMKGLIKKYAGVEKVPDRMAYEAGVDITPPPSYAMVAQACGGYGQTVENPEDVLSALEEALRQVRSGKPAVLDVILARA
jgi:acetolactate synthase-1/2/3 large subunit